MEWIIHVYPWRKLFVLSLVSSLKSLGPMLAYACVQHLCSCMKLHSFLILWLSLHSHTQMETQGSRDYHDMFPEEKIVRLFLFSLKTREQREIYSEVNAFGSGTDCIDSESCKRVYVCLSILLHVKWVCGVPDQSISDKASQVQILAIYIVVFVLLNM